LKWESKREPKKIETRKRRTGQEEDDEREGAEEENSYLF